MFTAFGMTYNDLAFALFELEQLNLSDEEFDLLEQVRAMQGWLQRLIDEGNTVILS
jgi:hypothetical protein